MPTYSTVSSLMVNTAASRLGLWVAGSTLMCPNSPSKLSVFFQSITDSGRIIAASFFNGLFDPHYTIISVQALCFQIYIILCRVNFAICCCLRQVEARSGNVVAAFQRTVCQICQFGCIPSVSSEEDAGDSQFSCLLCNQAYVFIVPRNEQNIRLCCCNLGQLRTEIIVSILRFFLGNNFTTQILESIIMYWPTLVL